MGSTVYILTHSFVTLEQRQSEWLTSLPTRFNLAKRIRGAHRIGGPFLIPYAVYMSGEFTTDGGNFADFSS
jgi:hypothetical protein